MKRVFLVIIIIMYIYTMQGKACNEPTPKPCPVPSPTETPLLTNILRGD